MHYEKGYSRQEDSENRSKQESRDSDVHGVKDKKQIKKVFTIDY